MQTSKVLLILVATMTFAIFKSSAQQLNVVFKDKKAFLSVKVDSETGQINLDKIPDTILLDFPDENPQNFTLQFNKDTAVFEVGFNCTSKNCINLLLSDIKDNKVMLVFNRDELIAINNRTINSKKIFLLDKTKSPYIALRVINKKPEEKNDKKLVGFYEGLKVDTSNFPQITLIPETDNEYNFKDCNKMEALDQKERVTKTLTTTEKDFNLFEKLFEKNSNFHKELVEKKITPKYWVVYDNREGKNVIPYYFKINNNKSYSTDNKFIITKVSIAPKVRKHVVYSILGPKDSVYTIDNSTAQYYTEAEAKISETLNGINPMEVETPITKKTDEKKDSSIEPKIPSGNSLVENYTVLANEKDPIKKLSLLKEKFPSTYSEYFSNNQIVESFEKIGSSEMKKSVGKDSTDMIESLNELLDNYLISINKVRVLQAENKRLVDKVNSLNKKLSKDGKTIANLQNQIREKDKEIITLKKSLHLSEINVAELISSIASLSSTKKFAAILFALESDLEKFNAEYDDISFVEKRYFKDLSCLQLNIIKLLNITSVNTSEDLAKAIVDRVKADKAAPMFYLQIGRVIKDIELNYKIAIEKKPRYAMFSVSKKTPNSDELITSLKTKNVSNAFYTDTFKTSLGLKIDFSTGIFINGLSNSSFVTSQHTFRYRESRDTVVVRGGQAVDSTLYTGNVQNASGNLIQANKPKISYSAGFLAHVYPRTGMFTNFGLVTGVTINNSNTSPIQLLLGGSIMFNAGKSSRISIVGGCTWGQVKELSAVAEQYKWDEKANPNNKLFNSAHEVPLFYNGSSDLPTFNKWKTSWFFGVTYNFASLNL
jgi:hypothetical protein